MIDIDDTRTDLAAGLGCAAILLTVIGAASLFATIAALIGKAL